jgi:hypothetical protein
MDETLTPEAEVVPTLSAARRMEAQNASAPAFVPASRKAFPAAAAAEPVNFEPARSDSRGQEKSRGGFAGRFVLFLLVLGALAAAFYGGRKYKGPIPYIDPDSQIAAQSSPTATATPAESLSSFEVARRDVDRDPGAWLATTAKNDLTRQGVQNPLDSIEPAFLYLYGRASLLTGNTDQAARAFEAVIARASSNPSPENMTLRKEATLGMAAVALKSEKDRPAALTHFDESIQKPSATVSPAGSQPTP